MPKNVHGLCRWPSQVHLPSLQIFVLFSAVRVDIISEILYRSALSGWTSHIFCRNALHELGLQPLHKRCVCARWTTGLLNRALNRGSVVMRVDGPYGEFAEHPEWTHYKTLVIIAGGIGVSAASDPTFCGAVFCHHASVKVCDDTLRVPVTARNVMRTI